MLGAPENGKWNAREIKKQIKMNMVSKYKNENDGDIGFALSRPRLEAAGRWPGELIDAARI